MPDASGRIKGIAVPRVPWRVEILMEDGSWEPGELKIRDGCHALVTWGESITTWFHEGEWRYADAAS